MWIFLGLTVAFLHATEGAWCKHLGLKGFPALFLSLAIYLFALPVYLLILAFTRVPEIGPYFWRAAIVTTIINVATINLYMKAIRNGDLGIVFPLLSLTPAFMLVSSWTILKEKPDAAGCLGVISICLGVFLLGLNTSALARPRTSALSSPAVYALICAVLWSVSANFDKLAAQNSSPVFYLLVKDGAVSLLLVFWILASHHSSFRTHALSSWWQVILVGLLSGLGAVLQISAQTMTYSAYPIAIKRLGMILAGIYGRIFFGEQLRFNRVAAWLAILGGLFLITI
ncbi:MAG: EamA family transporter [Elusimicrobia bacterium]|nr:EamA family transporter [Elusimicrobiota bacterium]